MKKNLLIINIFISLLIAVGIFTETSAELIDRVAAIVNNEIITLSDIKKAGYPAIKNIEENFTGEDKEEKIREAYQKILDELIIRTIKLQKAKKMGIAVSEKEVEEAIMDVKTKESLTDEMFEQALAKENLTLDSYKKEIEKQIKMQKLFEQEVRIKITVDEEEIQKHYEENKEKYRLPETFKVKHILFKLEEDADSETVEIIREKASSVLNQLKQGADFAETAKTYSEDASADVGGELGTFQKGQLLPEIEKTILAMESGDISNLVQTKYGLHIVKLEENTLSSFRPYEEVKTEIKHQLLQEKIDPEYEKWMKELKEKAVIEIKL